MAVGEEIVQIYPASQLFVPKQVQQPVRRVMTFEEVRKLFGVLEQRERLYRQDRRSYPSCAHASGSTEVIGYAKNGEISWGGCSFNGLIAEIEGSKQVSIDTRPLAWIFPSERMRTPVAKDNCWRRYILPKLKETGLDWVNFQVMRRTHSYLMKHLQRSISRGFLSKWSCAD